MSNLCVLNKSEFCELPTGCWRKFYCSNNSGGSKGCSPPPATKFFSISCSSCWSRCPALLSQHFKINVQQVINLCSGRSFRHLCVLKQAVSENRAWKTWMFVESPVLAVYVYTSDPLSRCLFPDKIDFHRLFFFLEVFFQLAELINWSICILERKNDSL